MSAPPLVLDAHFSLLLPSPHTQTTPQTPMSATLPRSSCDERRRKNWYVAYCLPGCLSVPIPPTFFPQNISVTTFSFSCVATWGAPWYYFLPPPTYHTSVPPFFSPGNLPSHRTHTHTFLPPSSSPHPNKTVPTPPPPLLRARQRNQARQRPTARRPVSQKYHHGQRPPTRRL